MILDLICGIAVTIVPQDVRTVNPKKETKKSGTTITGAANNAAMKPFAFSPVPWYCTSP
jgi:hypothetical protein